MSRVLSAVAWPYANGPRHIGHVAGFGVPSDVFSRYMRMAGHDVLMVSGTDEHGTPILIAADEAGVTPQQLADENHRVIAEDLTALGISYDLYTRTTTRNHTAVVQELFTGVYANGYFIEKTTYGAISPSTGRTLPDRYIEGTCPICAYPSARGDQCDNCGNQLDPADLLEPRSRINGEVPEFVETQHFFLDLPALADALKEWLDEREASGTWRPNVIRFSQNILEEIRPRAMTRDIDWGIPVPLDGWRDDPTKRLYVWFDAVIGYLSASIESGPSLGRGRGRPGCLACLVERPGSVVLLLHGQGQHHLPQPDLARRAAGLQRQGGQGRQAGGVRRAQFAHRGRLLGVPHHGGQEVLVLAARRDLCARPAQPLPAGRLPLLRGRRRAGEPGLRLHLGRVRTPHQRRARGRLGQPGQPHGHHGRQELRRDPARRGADRHGPGAARPHRRDLRGRRRPDRPPPAEGGHRRGDARRGGREPLPLRLRALAAQGGRRAGAAAARSCTWSPSASPT